MSWQAYVDLLLTPVENGSHLEAAAICGLDGGIWASGAAGDATFPPLTTEQVTTLANGFHGDTLLALQSNGLFLGDDKYRVVQCEPSTDPGAVIRAKFGQMGFCAVRTGTAVVIGFCKEPTPTNQAGMAFGEACSIVQKVSGTLMEYGY